MLEQEIITLLAVLSFRESVDDAVLEALAALVAAVRQEPGCLAYAAHVHAEDPKRVLFYERWQDKDALEVHSAAAALATFREDMGPRIAGPSELNFWKRLE
ncbi:MAG: antibiotic biosynthesis monooxygenase [Humidesulfovibrio sp.]|nr:antibiotic biosynthesis monooxygenase [Humidesulfovibrio sp.]